MVRVRDIMTSELVTVTPETSIREAMETLGRYHVSGAPVVSGGTLLGVVSATDLLTFVGALSGVPTERDADTTEWGEWPDSPRADSEGSEPASAFFAELWDDAGVDVATRTSSVSGPEWNALEEHDVSEVMTRSPLTTLPPDADVRAAADLMRRFRIHRVLVTDDDHLVGIVSSLDIARVVAEQRLTDRVFVFNRDGWFDAPA